MSESIRVPLSVAERVALRELRDRAEKLEAALVALMAERDQVINEARARAGLPPAVDGRVLCQDNALVFEGAGAAGSGAGPDAGGSAHEEGAATKVA